MIDGELSVLTLMTNLLLILLWSALGCAALLWLVMVSGLLRNAVAMVLPGGRGAQRVCASDIQYLRSMHIRL